MTYLVSQFWSTFDAGAFADSIVANWPLAFTVNLAVGIAVLTHYIPAFTRIPPTDDGRQMAVCGAYVRADQHAAPDMPPSCKPCAAWTDALERPSSAAYFCENDACGRPLGYPPASGLCFECELARDDAR